MPTPLQDSDVYVIHVTNCIVWCGASRRPRSENALVVLKISVAAKATDQRIRTLVRAVNVRRGLWRKDERPPEDHWAVRDEKYKQELLTKYYTFKGWDDEGIPTRQTVERLDMAYVADDLEQRGILTVGESASASRPPAETATI